MEKPDCIVIRQLRFSYPDIKDVISGIDLVIGTNEKVALVGPNGSGKTTLFFLLCGLLRPDSGAIEIAGASVRYNSFNRNIGYLFQSPDDQLFSATIFDDIAFGPLNMGLDREAAVKQVERAMEKTATASLRHKSPHHLSGGERRLAAMATLLAMEPRVYLLDEPTSNLDSRNRRNMISLVRGIPGTLFISSHDLEFLLEVCARCVLIDNGAVVADGDIRNILGNEPLLRQHHLEKPHSLIPHSHSS
jgi:cobalt/nickel transport system ATP-binding protein